VIRQIDTRVHCEVERQVHSTYLSLFHEGDRAFVPQAFRWAKQCFDGHYADYQPIDARYHDFEHTLQGTLCLALLFQGRHSAKASPPLPIKMFELSLLAMLFHDAGYLKKKDDAEGSGAKYTSVHVGRSALFAKEFLTQQGYSAADITAIQNMIRCTGVNVDLQSIPFQSELEKLVGFALGTADLLGQMAALDYVDKLPVLYEEFAEAARYYGAKSLRVGAFNSAEELMRNTPDFWESYVLPRIQGDFSKLYTFLNDPYPDGPNPYLRRIEQNMTRLRQEFGASKLGV